MKRKLETEDNPAKSSNYRFFRAFLLSCSFVIIFMKLLNIPYQPVVSVYVLCVYIFVLSIFCLSTMNFI